MKRVLLCVFLTGCGIDGSKLCLVDDCIWEKIFNGSSSSSSLGMDCTLIFENGELILNESGSFDTGEYSTESCNGDECVPADWCSDGYCDTSLNCSAYNYDCGDCE